MAKRNLLILYAVIRRKFARTMKNENAVVSVMSLSTHHRKRVFAKEDKVVIKFLREKTLWWWTGGPW